MENKQVTATTVPTRELFNTIEQMLLDGHDVKFTVVGNSMWPLLRNRKDQVVLRKVNAKELKKGDIVLYKPDDGRYILHRITKVRNGKLRTTGDNNCFHDGEFSDECVLGKAVSLIRNECQIDCTKIWVRLFGRVWSWLYPVRPLLLRVVRKLAAVVPIESK